MKKSTLLRMLAFIAAIVCAGCDRAAWDIEGGPSLDGMPTPPLRVVQARARLIHGEIQLDLRNTATEAMCFWAASFPTPDFPVGFRIFSPEGAEKRSWISEPSGDRVLEIGGGEIVSTDVKVRPWFESNLREGECVLFEAVYFPCTEAGKFRLSQGTPLQNAGLVQSTWRVQNAQLTLIPQSEPSCRNHSWFAPRPQR